MFRSTCLPPLIDALNSPPGDREVQGLRLTALEAIQAMAGGEGLLGEDLLTKLSSLTSHSLSDNCVRYSDVNERDTNRVTVVQPLSLPPQRGSGGSWMSKSEDIKRARWPLHHNGPPASCTTEWDGDVGAGKRGTAGLILTSFVTPVLLEAIGVLLDSLDAKERMKATQVPRHLAASYEVPDTYSRE